MEKKGFRITKLWGYFAVRDGDEGICAHHDGVMGWMPLIASDRVRMEQLKPVAQVIANQTGLTIKLAEFTERKDIEEITRE